MISLTAKILILVFLFFSVFAIGLHVDLNDLSALLKKRKLLFKSIITNILLIPLFSVLLIKIVVMPPHIALAFIILGLMPGGLSAIQFASKIEGESAYVGLMSCFLTLYSIFISPFLIIFFIKENVLLNMPYLKILMFSTLFMFFPLIFGILMRVKQIKFGSSIATFSSLIGTTAFIAMIIATMDMRSIAIAAHSLKIAMMMLIFIAGSMLIGWLMGGPEKKDRTVLTIITGMRHVAIALFITMEILPTAKIIQPLTALGALMVLPNMLFTLSALFWRRQRKGDQVAG